MWCLMKLSGIKIVVHVIFTAIICVAYSEWGISPASRLKTGSIQKAQQNVDAIHLLDTLSADFQAMQKLLYTYFVTGNAANATTSLAEEVQNINNEISGSIQVVDTIERQCRKFRQA